MKAAWQQLLQQWLAARAPRERQALLGMTWVVGIALLWSVGVAPAWRTLKEAPARQAQIAPQLQTMRAQAAQAQTLKKSATAPAKPLDRQMGLAAATQRHLGTQTRVQTQGEQATVVLQSVPATTLAAWLEDVRVNAHATPTNVRLSRDPATQDKAPTSAPTWSGTIVFGGEGLAAP